MANKARAYKVSGYRIGHRKGVGGRAIIEITYSHYFNYFYPWRENSHSNPPWDPAQGNQKRSAEFTEKQLVDGAYSLIKQYVTHDFSYKISSRQYEQYEPCILTLQDEDFQATNWDIFSWPEGGYNLNRREMALEFQNKPQIRNASYAPKFSAALFTFSYINTLIMARSILLNFTESIGQDKYLRILFLELLTRLSQIEKQTQ